MQKRFFPLMILALMILVVSCSKKAETSYDSVVGLNETRTSVVPTQTCDRITFEGYAHGTILSSVTSEGGFGPIAMTSVNPSNPEQPHAAMVFDSDIPVPLPFTSLDLGTPNGVAVPGGPGVGAAGEGGTYVNNTRLENILVIKEFVPVQNPPVEADVNGTVTFDFPGEVTVTATSITVIDVELTEQEAATVELLGLAGNTIKTINFPSTGQNGVAVVSLENTPGVAGMRLNLNGSMGIDNIAFCRETPPPTGCAFTQGYWKNHGPNANGNQENEYPVTSLTLGANVYTDVQLESILRTPVGNGDKANGLISLAHQLIAAKLNIANGTDPSTIAATITAADNLISTLGSVKIPPIGNGKLTSAQVSSLVETLTKYNEGKLAGGPSHCD